MQFQIPHREHAALRTNRESRTQRRVLSIAVSIGLAILSGQSYAQAASAQPSTQPSTQRGTSVGGVDSTRLEEIIVTARDMESTLPIQLSRYGVDVEFVTEEAIKNHGFFDIVQAVEMLAPGVHLTSQAGAFSYTDLQINGSRPSDVLWTVDGVRINNRLYNSTSPADTLPASMIERTEVMSGGHGLLYGTQAVAGVMNVVTRSFSDEFGGSVQVGTDSNNGQHHNAYARGSIGGHQLVGWVSKDKTDGYEVFDFYNPSVVFRDRAYDVESFGLKYGYDITDNLRIAITSIRTDAALDYPNPAQTNVNDRREDIQIARLDYSPSQDMQFFIKSYYHNWDTNYYPKTSGSANALYWGYKDKGFGAGGQMDFGHGLEYHAGLDYQSYEGEDEVWIIAKQQEDVTAGYFQVRTTDDLWVDTRMAAGLRHNDTGGISSTVGSLSGEHYFSDNLYVEGMYGTSFVLPSAEALYLADPCCGWHGNPNVGPEESRGFDYGIGGLLELGNTPLEWKLSGWSRKVDNLIDWGNAAELGISVPEGFETTSYNRDGETKVNGWDVLLRGNLTSRLRFSYNYTRSTEKNNGVQLTNRPRNNQKFMLSYANPDGRFGMDLSAKYVGESTITGSGVPNDAYLVANFGAHAYVDANQSHRINLRIENLFDEGYVTRYYNVTREDNGQTQLAGRLGPDRTWSLNYTYVF